ncbi:MAG: DNA ligase D [Candidatus Rokuibacteriota bacterium]
MSAHLDDYRKKRDPHRTPEPFGGPRASEGRLFVVQKHAARQLHYDFRLEMGGTLKSWAVPKGPSVRAHDKRLAVHVEDHPVEYADFEGTIPEGNYGAGAVIVWDRGWFRLTKSEPAEEQLARGTLEFELFGVKLRGRWTLARMGGRRGDDKNWLLLKKADGFARDEDVTARWPESVLSGLTVEEIRSGPGRVAALREYLNTLKAPAGDVRAATQPVMLATLVDEPLSGREWLFEIKYDGVRVLAQRHGERVELRTRSHQNVTTRYPEIVTALRALPLDRFLLDGEIVAFDERGRSSFQRLQSRMGLTRPDDIERAKSVVPVNAIFFDCLALDGRDLRAVPLRERKACLARLLPTRGVIQYGDHVLEHGKEFFDAAYEQRLEGMIAKRVDSAYVGRRTRDWLKVKCQLRQEFVVGGWTEPQGTRAHFGALHLGIYEGERLVYVSKVGTGFDERTLGDIWKRLQPLKRATSPFDSGTPAGRGHHWVEPKLVCEVRFTEWTADGGIRHPAFLGLRDDKSPRECVRERPAEPPERRRGGGGSFGQYSIPSGSLPRPAAFAHHRGADPPRVTITNPTKVFWPATSYTKRDLVDYYERIAPFMLPYLKDRPVVLTRYPDGIEGKSFFQKDAPTWAPAWIRTERIHSPHAQRDIHYFIVNDVETLRFIANMAAIPLHFWHSRLGTLDRPDWLVLDLDPKGAPFQHVVKVARALKRILDDLDLPSFVKTSGATGLHILVPLGARYGYDEARTFARLLAVMGVEVGPEISTVARPLKSRGGKVYIDWGQNGHGQTVVAPFSVRPRPGAPVSCPLRWEEIDTRLDPAQFTIKTAPARFEKHGDPMAPVLSGAIDLRAVLARMERRR